MIAPSFHFWGFADFDAVADSAESQEQGKDVVRKNDVLRLRGKTGNSVFDMACQYQVSAQHG